MKNGLAYLSIADCAALVKDREVSPVDLVQALLQRIELIDPKISAFVTLTAEQAMAAARQAEQEIVRGRARGVLHGIPYALKDIYYTAGIRTTGHSKICEDFVPDYDATAVRRLADSGAILMGKLATHEFAHGGPSFDLPWPPARNPWNTDHFSGGSSSGSAAAVAAGLVKAALGTDTGGSIRSPAGLCGVAGLKPTYGRVSRHGVFPNSFSLDHCGPLAWTAADCAYILQAIAGYDPLDPSSADVPVDDYIGTLTNGIKGLKIGVVRHFYEKDLPAGDEVRAAMEATLGTLTDLGAILVDVRLRPLEEYAACKMAIQLAEIYAVHEKDLQQRPQDFGENFRFRVLPGAFVRAVDYVQAQRKRRILADEATALFDEVDLMVTSGIYGPAPTFEGIDKGAKFTKPSITIPFNVTGHPAISICNGFSKEGLPLALQIVGPAFGEASVLRAAHAYEEATQWRHTKPRLAAAPEVSETSVLGEA